MLASVFSGKDIRTRAKVALKIGHADLPLILSYEYDVYTTMSGGAGISPVLWYGKEGLHEVLVLENLGASLEDLVSEQWSIHEKTFLYTP